MRKRRWSGARGSSIWMVEQFGLAMMKSSAVRTSALISGTTSFLVGSIRQQEELSTTRQPTAANRGASSREASPPAENKARSGRSAIASSALTTVCSCPWKRILRPTERAEATGMKEDTGKCLSSKTSTIRVPTRPVTPTTATFISLPFRSFYTKPGKDPKAFPRISYKGSASGYSLAAFWTMSLRRLYSSSVLSSSSLRMAV